MHNKIYQIATEPITVDKYITESEFTNHWFTCEIADYVSVESDRSGVLMDFKKRLEDGKIAEFSKDGTSFWLIPEAQGKYFEGDFSVFQKTVKELNTITFEDFCHNQKGVSEKLYLLNSSFSEKNGDYVSSDEFDTVSLDEFVREAKIGVTYYIGAVLDYHY